MLDKLKSKVHLVLYSYMILYTISYIYVILRCNTVLLCEIKIGGEVALIKND